MLGHIWMDGFSYIFTLLRGIKNDIHFSDILSSDVHCTILFFYTAELISCLATYLNKFTYQYTLFCSINISIVHLNSIFWQLHYLIMGSSLISLKCPGPVWMYLKLKTFIPIVTEKRTAQCTLTLCILNLLHL